ncbi:MAG: zinc ribbon domain-containing protein [Verrucomicrobia bacterium]|nr:zinc ribbon domain-containing protein [Verrucomicrobiota bacterium]
MIECPKCQHDNDLGRIFCSKCGEKLDISKVSAPSGVKRVAKKGKKTVPAAKMASFIAGQAFKVVLLASVSAFLTLVWLPPKLDRKGFSGANLDALQTKRAQVEEAISGTKEVKVVFEESDLNAHIAQVVQNTIKAAGETKGPRLESMYVQLGDGVARITVQLKWKWFRLAPQMEARADNSDGRWRFAPTAAWIGRLRIPPQATPKVAERFGTFLKDLETERQLFEQLASAEIKPGQLIVTTQKES